MTLEELIDRVIYLEAITQRLSVRYNEVVTRFNAHTHGGVTTGGGSTGVNNQTALTAVDATFTLNELL
jgi:hypothetical protein